jgi:hypothetical protein
MHLIMVYASTRLVVAQLLVIKGSLITIYLAQKNTSIFQLVEVIFFAFKK